MSTEPIPAEVVLSLDTSTDASVALYRDGQVLSRQRSHSDRRHAEMLVPMIHQALGEAGLGPREVSTVVIGTGPAPFTGLRVGLATGQAFAHARGVQALGVCSLDALALAAGDGQVLVVTDARRRELYYARYQVSGACAEQVLAPAVGAPQQIAAEHADLIHSAQVRGPGLLVAGGQLGLDPGALPAMASDGVDPVDLARLALHRREAGGDLSLTPLYLRRPDVHPAAARKRVR